MAGPLLINTAGHMLRKFQHVNTYLRLEDPENQ